MTSTRLDVAFNSHLVATPAAIGPGATIAALRDQLVERLSRHGAALEFGLLAFWAFSPFALALLLS